MYSNYISNFYKKTSLFLDHHNGLHTYGEPLNRLAIIMYRFGAVIEIYYDYSRLF